VKELADQWGIKEEAITSGPHKNMLSPLKEMSPEEKEILQDLVDEAYQNFVDVVVQGRGMEKEKVLNLADGRIYSGEQALEAGLVDELGYLDDAIDQAAELAGIQNPTVVTYVQTGLSLFNTLMANLQRTEVGIESILHLDTHPKVMYLLNW
jgi:protease-4